MNLRGPGMYFLDSGNGLKAYRALGSLQLTLPTQMTI